MKFFSSEKQIYVPMVQFLYFTNMNDSCMGKLECLKMSKQIQENSCFISNYILLLLQMIVRPNSSSSLTYPYHYKVRKRKVKTLTRIEEITEGWAHENTRKLYRVILTGTAAVINQKIFTLFRLIKTAVPVEISQYTFCVPFLQ